MTGWQREQLRWAVDRATVKQLARDIAGGVGDDREGWYGAAEALALAGAYLSLTEDLLLKDEALRTIRAVLTHSEQKNGLTPAETARVWAALAPQAEEEKP